MNEQIKKDEKLLENFKNMDGEFALHRDTRLIHTRFIEELLRAQARVTEAKVREEIDKDMSWCRWEEDFAFTWMGINPNHGQANARCYIKSLVDKYVKQQREKDVEIVKGFILNNGELEFPELKGLLQDILNQNNQNERTN